MDTLLVALLGLLVGGLINSLADDLPTGRQPSPPKYPNGRRRPPLAWLGATAFLLNLRRASQTTDESTDDDCERQELSWRYPLVEIALSASMTLVFAVARDMHAMSIEETLLYLALVALFVLIAVIDLEHMRILVTPLLACCLLALVRAFAFPQSPPTFASMLVGALCACLVFSLVYLGGRLFARLAERYGHSPADITVFGRGDVYLMTVGGLIAGFPNVLVIMALTILLGGIGALTYLLRKSASGGYQRFSAFPYAPYILTSIYVVMLLRGEASRLIFGL